MFVVSRVESGEDDKAGAALLPQAIGSIQTIVGSGTLRGASSVAVEAVTDPVCRGDIIETAAGGRIGILFVDGTVFNLSCSTRVVLNEFVCDSTGISHSASLGVTGGPSAFIAGQVAKTACLTPVVSIRGRPHTGGIGMLWLTALTFSLMKEVQAADPNLTFLDDGSITYKDLEHGAFELVTKEVIPRHFLVEDPGQTIVLRSQGSTISVNQSTNSAARMAELQAAQRDALATLEKGLGSTGSSTPPPLERLPVQPINFIEIDRSSPAQDLPALPPVIFAPVPEMIIGQPPPPQPMPPTLNAVLGPTETDTVVFDVFTATSGTFLASSPNSATLTFGISGGTAGSSVIDGMTYDVSKAGPYGTLYVDSTTGAYTFVPDSDAINALTAPTITDFTITVSDGTLSANQTFTIAINGANDAAIIAGATTGAVIEASGVANATLGTPSATGTLTNTDVDDAPNTFTPVSSPTASAHGFGTFTMTANGVWAYTIDQANSAVQALNVGGTLTDTFAVTTIDGTPQVVTVTINGANDAAVISGTTTGSVIGAICGAPTATGTLTDTDVDNTPNSFTAVSCPTASDGGYGTFTMTADGVWTYKLDDASSAVKALNVGDALIDTFTVTTIDGTAQVVTIAINGINDAAVISGLTSGTVIEASGVATTTLGTPSATGTLTSTDVDDAPNTFTAVSSPTASANGFGTFTMTADGVWAYTIDEANSAVQALNVGNTLTDSFTVTTIDGTPQVVTVTIHGANDAAVVSGATTGSVTEDSGATCGTPTATGSLTDTDVDNTPNNFTAVSCPTASDGGYGTFTMMADGVWAYKLDDANCTVQALDAGDTLTDTFTVTTIDGTPQVVTVTIHGASDADPNDFDYLATGLAVICDPPYVYGTPSGDSIAGGGHQGQNIYGGGGNDTINGTGKCDLIYAGSGNDTVKGNDGDDKIYGGSGSDTINGNNGCDTIIGGYGADNLRGGNGNDRFVYLSVADSNSAQFDTISDFASGSDRIDLTALGALAFADLALTSTSTSVPKHTIVWFYDSTANQTIVYVNPTAQILSVGNSALLEIHLQGLATIEPSDFIFIATTTSAQAIGEPIDLAIAAGTDESAVTISAANVLCDSTVNDGTLPANGTRSLQTTDEGHSFDVDQDQINLIDYAKFASFDEVRTDSTENTGGHPATTLVNAQSIVLQGFHVTEPIASNFAFEASAESGLTNAGAIPGTHDHSSGNHGQAVERFMANLGVAWTDRDDQIIVGEASGHSAGVIHVVGGPGDTLCLGDSFHFNDETSEGLKITDVTVMDFASASISYSEHAARTGRDYATVQAAQTVELSLLGQHSADEIHVFQHRAGGSIVHHVSHDLMV
jgi:VCBS repeat-containing protein